MNVSSPGVRRQRGKTRPAMPVDARRCPSKPGDPGDPRSRAAAQQRDAQAPQIGEPIETRRRSGAAPQQGDALAPQIAEPSRPEGEVGLHRCNVVR